MKLLYYSWYVISNGTNIHHQYYDLQKISFLLMITEYFLCVLRQEIEGDIGGEFDSKVVFAVWE